MAGEASGIGAQLAYVFETSDGTLSGTNNRGTKPSTPTLNLWRSTSKNINPQRNALRPNEISNNGMRLLARHGFEQVQGSPGFDLALTDFNDQIGWAMMSDWTAASADTGSTSIDAATSGSKFTDPAGGGTMFSSFAAGDTITASGFGSDVDGVYVITEVTDADNIVVAPAIPADVTGDADEQITKPGKFIKRPKSPEIIGMTLERWFSDAGTPFGQEFTSCAPTGFNISLPADGVSTAQTGMVGIKSALSTSRLDANPTEPAGNTKMAAISGAVVIDGTEYSIITSASVNLAQGNTVGQSVIGSRFAPDVFAGESNITGQISFYIKDKTFLEFWDTEKILPIWLLTRPADGSTDFHSIYLPEAKIMAVPVDPPQQGPILMNADYEAGYNGTFGSSMMFQRSDS